MQQLTAQATIRGTNTLYPEHGIDIFAGEDDHVEWLVSEDSLENEPDAADSLLTQHGYRRVGGWGYLYRDYATAIVEKM